ncbi:hypothetical protein QFC20_007853 [Naganishia adeliensis]|uniref:Uncharacterized protein n=1 Tax=Naganishia adeliensis TaxID=92952 RepID=A0ACC2UVG8_9TREE|nr:hypothetical protein QFC20_007853 [Naganishia adeliensis]
MLRNAIEGIKQNVTKNWLLWVTVKERRIDELPENAPDDEFGDWPPVRAMQLTTQIVHRPAQPGDNDSPTGSSPSYPQRQQSDEEE